MISTSYVEPKGKEQRFSPWGHCKRKKAKGKRQKEEGSRSAFFFFLCHRVPLDVAGTTEEVFCHRHRGALEAPLPQVADKTGAAVEVMDIRPQQASHSGRRVRHHFPMGQQMKVVAQQAVVIEAYGENKAVRQYHTMAGHIMR
ncbi:MAG: hypothetical protein JO112_18105 [Planctomycetes bacterium]|nr:hypothetical protein [Planctomycetota bacterium]